jgi:hypothetical protein
MAITIRTGEQSRQVQMVGPGELVGEDDVLRRVERLAGREGGRERWPGVVVLTKDTVGFTTTPRATACLT